MWVMKMECPRCHNRDPKYFYQYDGQCYCRRCIEFKRVDLLQKRLTKSKSFLPLSQIGYTLSFDLSSRQQIISDQLVENYCQQKNSIVLAVCGSGKTEIVFSLILYALKQGHRVCFCIPRKELVIELYQRIKEAFYGIEIGLLYGGHIENPQAQFIICTMHQLYRFENDIGFDLMIADEVDAFPFYQNEVLNEIFMRCCLGQYVKLSATVQPKDIQNEELLIMNRRYHGYDLPVPRLILVPAFLQKWLAIVMIFLLKKKCIVYLPSIQLVEQFASSFQKFHIKVSAVSSQHLHNQKTVEALKQGKIQVIVSTTLLERGMTVEDVQVIVCHGEHTLFDQRTLIQIAGRVGRKPNYPTGKVMILACQKTKGILDCIRTIKRLNQMDV